MATTAMSATGSKERAMPATTMKAIIQEKYGSMDRLELREIERPKVDDEGVLVRVRAASLNPSDWRPISGKPYSLRPMFGGIRAPRNTRKGTDVSGVVESVGKNVTQFRPGDEVFGAKGGALAEYVMGKEKNFVPKPASLSFEQAAAIPIAGVTALQALRDHGRLQPGQRVLINGAAGGVGTFAVQIAKALGAHVTGVTSTRNLEMVRSLGADEVVDYTREDFTRSGKRFDLIVDNVGNRPMRRLLRVLTREGTLVTVGGKKTNWAIPLLGGIFKSKAMSPFVSQRLVIFIARLDKEDLVALKDLVEAGKLTPVVDRTFPLGGVHEAFRYVETLHARGKVVVTL